MTSIGRHRAPSPPLELTLAEIDDSAFKLTAHGHLDADTVDDLDEALQVMLAQPGLTRLLMDFGPLASIDAAGITALVTAHQHAQRRGIVLAVTSCSSEVRRSLEITGLYGPLTQDLGVSQHGKAVTGTSQPRVPGSRQGGDRAPDLERVPPSQAVAAVGPHA